MSGLLQSVSCLQGTSLLWHVSEFYTFLRMSIVTMYLDNTSCSFIRPCILVNSAAVNMDAQIPVQVPAFSECVPRSEIVGSYVNSVLNILKNQHALFHSSCTVLNFH